MDISFFNFTNTETYAIQVRAMIEVLREFNLDLEDSTLEQIADECLQVAYLAPHTHKRS